MTEHETPERTVAYVVYADYGYGSAAIKAFVSKPDAVGFRDACQIHHDNEPRYEGNDDDDTALEQWGNEHNLWVQQHPGGEQIGAEGFFVSEIELVPKQAVPKAGEAPEVGADPTVNDAQIREAFCAKCHHRWPATMRGAELCGDCWHEYQALQAKLTATQQERDAAQELLLAANVVPCDSLRCHWEIRASTLENEADRLRQRADKAEQERDALKAHAMPDGLKCIDLGECLAQHEQVEYFERKLKEAEQEIARLREYAQHKKGCPFGPEVIWSSRTKCTCGLAALLAPQEP